MNTIILFFRDRDAVRLAVNSAAPVMRARMRPVLVAGADARPPLTCRWQRNPANRRLEGRWARERNTVSEEGVSRSFRFAFAA